jgi:steroid delta-isomerase-like uncharacterized protein
LDRETTKQVVAMYGRAFPDLNHTVDEWVVEGDTVGARWTVNGTHQGEFQGIPASGKSIKRSGITVHHLAGGKLRETWLTFDTATLLQQIGAVAAVART